MRLRTLDDLPKNLKGKRVLVRVDWNVPLGKNWRVAKDARFRLEATKPTVSELLKRGAIVILLAHLGRPDGKPVRAFSLRHIIPAAERILGRRISLLPLPTKITSYPAAAGPRHGGGQLSRRSGTPPWRWPVTSSSQLFLFENLRFHPGEEGNDVRFARSFAAYGDYFVNDAFGNAHRKHASMALLPKLLPSVAGRLLEREVTTLSRLLHAPEHPFVAIIGGAKISTKFGVMKALLKICDRMLTGGGIANTLLLAQGMKVGASLVDRKYTLRPLKKGKLVLPIWDAVVSRRLEKVVGVRTINLDRGELVEENELIVDFGPRTMAQYIERLRGAKTILWNGTLGVNEVPAFNHGNISLATAIAQQTAKGALTVVGGGEMMSMIDRSGLRKEFSFCSTGGGAMLEFLEGKKLPGILPLIKK